MATTKRKRIALVAHDNRKSDMVEWVRWNYKVLLNHQLICTGTTGRLVEEAILQRMEEDANLGEKRKVSPRIIKLKSGPFGGDQQLGAMIAEGRIDLLIFLWDPMQPQPHDVDVKALLRISVLYNIPSACNRSTADFIISSPLMDEHYEPMVKDYSEYLGREIS
jgi:methylglyoxal synthase